MSDDLRKQFLEMLGSAPTNSQPPEEPAAQPAAAPNTDELLARIARLEKAQATPSAAQILASRRNPNPMSDGGTPGRTPTLESDDLPMWKWSQSKVDAFVREHGYRGFARYAKNRLPKDLHGVRFYIPRPGER